MVIGERLKGARRAAGLSQRALAEMVGVSVMAISKYERGLNTPSSPVLIRLAQALGVKTEYFLRPVTVEMTAPAFRCRSSLSVKEERAILARTKEWIERSLDVESFFEGAPQFAVPSSVNRHAGSLDDVERVAMDLRAAWKLGQSPIESVVEVLEDQGIKVGLVEAHDDFDGLTVWANGAVPVIIVKRGLPGDRQRFNLAHELGHLVLEPNEGVNDEKAAHRFAGAFLVPEAVVRFELGSKRRSLDLRELHSLKHKYGMSMQAWIYRAKDLEILSEAAATRWFREFRRRGWHREEPGEPVPPEKAGRRMERLVMRALVEGLISRSRAAELLGKPLARFVQEEERQYGEYPAIVGS